MDHEVKVCVVDDDPLVRGLVRAILAEKGYEVLEAGDGEAGMRILERGAPDLLVTDIMMPNQDGIETIRAMKRDFPRTPILAMSGSSDGTGADFLAMARKLGADAHIKKPFEPAAFLERVESLLNR